MEKFPGFKIDLESTDKVLPLHQYIHLRFLDNETTALRFLFFFNLHGGAFCFLNFVN